MIHNLRTCPGRPRGYERDLLSISRTASLLASADWNTLVLGLGQLGQALTNCFPLFSFPNGRGEKRKTNSRGAQSGPGRGQLQPLGLGRRQPPEALPPKES